jgi:hypothetical protein
MGDMKQKEFGGLFGAVHFSPALEARHQAAPKQAKAKSSAEQVEIEALGNKWWVIQKITDRRSTLLVVEGGELGRYFEKREAGRWQLSIDQSFPSRAEASDFLATMGGLVALEDPNKAPRRRSESHEEAGALAYLRRVKKADEENARAPRVPWSQREAELFGSISDQYDCNKGVLSPKQWGLIVRMASQVAERFNRRKANNSRERESR